MIMLIDKKELKVWFETTYKRYLTYYHNYRANMTFKKKSLTLVWQIEMNLTTKTFCKRTCSSLLSLTFDYSPFSVLTYEQFLSWLDSSRYQRAYLGVNITTASLLLVAVSHHK